MTLWEMYETYHSSKVKVKNVKDFFLILLPVINEYVKMRKNSFTWFYIYINFTELAFRIAVGSYPVRTWKY